MQTDGSLPASSRGGIDGAMNRETTAAALALVCDRGNTHARNAIASTLSLFGAGALRFAADRGISVVALERDQTYNAASPTLARFGVEHWNRSAGERVTPAARARLGRPNDHHVASLGLPNGEVQEVTDPSSPTAFVRAKRIEVNVSARL